MRAHRLLMLIALMLFAATANSLAQSSEREQGEAVITGRVTVNGKPAAGFVVTLERVDAKRERNIMGMFQREPLLKALTDNEGRYRLTGLQAARYKVKPFAPSHITAARAGESGEERTVTVAAGDTIENIDFALARGGVITGRVTKADGRPIVGVTVQFTPVAEEKKPAAKDEDEDEDEDNKIGVTSYDGSIFGPDDFKTDDRGVYRIYGLPPGRYLVSVGGSGRSFEVKRRYHTQTFHPGVTDKAKATIVEVTPGSESANADIKLGLPSLTFRASGRVIDAETGRPLAKAIILTGSATEGSDSVATTATTGLSNEKGEFRLEGIMAGRHTVFATFSLDGQSEYYTDKAVFEIKNEDVTGLVIKAHRGLSMSGIAVAEGISDAAAVAKLSQMEMIAYDMPTAGQMPSYSRSKINPDGSFQFRGLRPGKTQITISSFTDDKKFHITRIERGGVEMKEHVEIAPGEQVTDLRVFLAYANASISGQVRIEGGALPKGTHLSVFAVRADQKDRFIWGGSHRLDAEVDANGRFEIEGLIPGEYEITVSADVEDGNKNAPQIPSVAQTVTVVANAETTVTIVLDLRRKEKER